MKFGICTLSQIPGRKEPDNSAEMTTQILFGESFEIINQTDAWFQVKLDHDACLCWIDQKQCTTVQAKTYQKLKSTPSYYTTDLVQVLQNAVSGEVFPVIIGSRLPFLDTQTNTLQIENLSFHFDGGLVGSEESSVAKKQLVENAYMYLNAPYQWGGRSPLGIDCSGFIQQVFRLNQINIPRNANEQAQLGETLSFVEESEPGDLAFFDDSEGNIIHVGMVLPDSEIIHASGQVRIDRLDHFGIFNKSTDQYTHQLRVIKRIVPSPNQI